MDHLKILKAVVLAEVTAEALDDIKETSLWRHNAKKYGKLFAKTLLPAANEYDSIYAESPQLANDLSKEIDSLVSKIAAANVVDFAMINQITEHYLANKTEWCKNFPLKFTELNT